MSHGYAIGHLGAGACKTSRVRSACVRGRRRTGRQVWARARGTKGKDDLRNRDRVRERKKEKVTTGRHEFRRGTVGIRTRGPFALDVKRGVRAGRLPVMEKISGPPE